MKERGCKPLPKLCIAAGEKHRATRGVRCTFLLQAVVVLHAFKAVE
jgi:hypothetical protein